jgi:hypothetical protein
MPKPKAEHQNGPTVAGIAVSNIRQAQKAMEQCFDFWQGQLPDSPWTKTEASKKLASALKHNVNQNFELAQRLATAKDLPEVTRIQTAFLQSQLRSLVDQAKDLTETVTRAAPRNQKTTNQK